MYGEKELERIVVQDFRRERMIEPDHWLNTKEGIIPWYRELQRVESSIARQIAQRRAMLKTMSPPVGSQPTKAYIESKQSFDIWHSRVVELLDLIGQRKKYVLSKIDAFGLDINDRIAIEAFDQILNIIDSLADPKVAIKHVERIARNTLATHYNLLGNSRRRAAS